MKTLTSVIGTHAHVHGPILRFTLALVLLPHGAQLLLGWFGGFGFTATMQYLTQQEGLPWLVGVAVILLQSVGALLILSGVFSRLLSLAMVGLFAGMIVTSHWHHGFFMNWMGNQPGEGFEYHLLAIGLSMALLVSGAGKWSLDYLLTRKFNIK